MPQDTTEFPLPNDATDEERETARREIAKYTKVTDAQPRSVRFEGRAIGQTGPIWHFQYLRMYQLPRGFLVAGHDLREGINVHYADTAEGLAKSFEHAGVQEFIEDELRFRGVIRGAHARTS